MHRLFLNVGYDLSEQQLRPYFAKFGAIKDLYLPKNVSGRNKGYGFLTYATKSALPSVAQQPRHVVDGKVVQVKLAGPRPVRESKPLTTTCTDLYRGFGRGHRLYVGGVAEAVTQERVRHHFTKWGDVLDVYFPAARGLSRSKYCFVTFGNNESAQQAYRESERSIDGWPLKSINVAEDRKDDGHQASPLAGKNWNGMSFPLPGSFEECTQEMEGSVADGGSTDTSLSLDNLALLAHQSILEAFGYNFSGEDSIPLPSFQEQCFDGDGYRSSPLN